MHGLLTYCTHAVMQATGPEATLRNLEPAPLSEYHVRRRHPHALR
jgi:hypothetical protein